jgi:multiple sugar transport system permease protein
MSGREIVDRYSSSVTATNFFDKNWNGVHFVKASLIPTFTTSKQYKEVLFQSPLYLRMFWNALLLTIPVVIGQVFLSALAAYAFELWNYKHKEKIFFLYILVMLMPAQVLLVPNFIVANFFHIQNSYLAIIMPKIFNPFGVFLIRQMSRNFPKEYVEAGFMDGATHIGIFRKIFVPIMKSALLLLTVLTFVDMWNAIEMPIVFINEVVRQPLSVYLSQIISGDAGNIFAVSILYMIPAILIFYTVARQMGDSEIYSGIKL